MLSRVFLSFLIFSAPFATPDLGSLLRGGIYSINIRKYSNFPFSPDANGKICFPFDNITLDQNGLSRARYCDRGYKDAEILERVKEIPLFLILSNLDLSSALVALANGDAMIPSHNISNFADDEDLEITIQMPQKVLSVKTKHENPYLDDGIKSVVSLLENAFL